MKYPFKIFPVGADKSPLIVGWQQKATQDPHAIAQWAGHGAVAWGIPCGPDNGLFVIDLDVDKATGEAIGEASLRALQPCAAIIEKANVRTPFGGRHIYCRHFEGARNSTSKIGSKIDTRGEGGYVVAPGSCVYSGHYLGHFPENLPWVPVGLRALLMHKSQTQARNGARLAPTGEVEELLIHIPADLPYGEWLTVLMGLHDRFKGSEDGLALADQWSATGAKYRKGEVAAKWRSFKHGGVTWATVPALARKYGADLSDIARMWAE